MHPLVHIFHIVGWRNDLATATLQALGNEARNGASVMLCLLAEGPDLLSVEDAQVIAWVVVCGELTSVNVRAWRLQANQLIVFSIHKFTSVLYPAIQKSDAFIC